MVIEKKTLYLRPIFNKGESNETVKNNKINN
jgi:hypothetical protein